MAKKEIKKEEVKENLGEKVVNRHSSQPLELDWSHKEEVKFVDLSKVVKK